MSVESQLPWLHSAQEDWGAARAPYLWPRRHCVCEDETELLRQSIRKQLQLNSSAEIGISEWVTFDSREVPHLMVIAIRDGQRAMSVRIAQSSSRLEGRNWLESVSTSWFALLEGSAGGEESAEHHSERSVGLGESSADRAVARAGEARGALGE